MHLANQTFILDSKKHTYPLTTVWYKIFITIQYNKFTFAINLI